MAWLCCFLTTSQGATDPRILARYRQMLAANPVEGPTLERLWNSAVADGTTEALLAEYAALAAKGDLPGKLIYALLLHRSSKTGEAVALLQQTAAEHPDSPLPHRSLAKLLSSPFAKAEALEAALQRTPQPTAPMWQELGEVWMTAGAPDKAIAAWEQMITLAPDSIELRQKLASLYVQRKLADKALPHLALVVEKGSPAAKVAALRDMAAIHQQQGDNSAALDALEKALSYTSGGHWMRTELIAQMIRYSRLVNAVDALESRWKAAAEANPRSPELWLQLAELYARNGDLEKEYDAVEKAVRLLPKDAALQTRLARLQVRLDRIPEAAATYDALIAAHATHPLRADWIFERAEIDVRLHAPDAARQRVAALEAASNDESISARTLAFYQQHRMGKAIEAQLARPGSNPVPLADYLFTQHRYEEARKVLQQLVPEHGSAEEKAAAYEKICETLKQAGQLEGAVEALRAALALTPDSRSRLLLLGDLLMTSPRENNEEARKVFEKAYTLSKAPEEQAEADLRLYRACERGFRREGLRAEHPLVSETLNQLKKEYRSQKNLENGLRLARWQHWSGDHNGAYAITNEVLLLEPTSLPAIELAATLEQTLGYRDRAIKRLQKLTELAPDRKEDCQKQIAQLYLLNRQFDEALTILEGLASPGDFAALADLANGQQQAERWFEALNTWERLYIMAKGSRKVEVLQPMVRAMLRLGMKQRVREVLWNAYLEQTDESIRNQLLNDLITQCQGRETMPWLIERLEAQVKASEATPEATNARHALATALKADGQNEAAYRQLKDAAMSADDRAAAEEALVKEAEANRDFQEAARHQALRIALLPRPSAQEWERLAVLQEAALDYPKADATRLQIVDRFPRDSEALLACARYFEKWSRYPEALRIYRTIRRFDPANLTAAAGVLRNYEATQPKGQPDAETVAAARGILDQTAPIPDDVVILPPEPPPLGNRLRAVLATYDRRGTVTIPDPRIPASEERHWRLAAIRVLAPSPNAPDGVVKEWLAQWEGAPVAERLWALEACGRGNEVLPLLKTWVTAADEPTRSYALLWYGLKYHAWAELGAWIWAPERRYDEQEAFRVLLGEWSHLREPVDLDALVAKASPGQIWPLAETLANQRRFDLAAALGLKLFAEPASVQHRGHQALSVVQWVLSSPNLAAHREKILALLKAIAVQPADSLEAPTFSAQRILYTMLSPEERRRWVEQMVKRGKEPGASPLWAALTESLLFSLNGEHAKAKAALQHLVALRPVTQADGPADERVWHFFLSTGIQFQNWGLHDAARLLWENALADEASIALQGARASASAQEMKVRLAAIALARASRSEFRQQVLTLSREQSPQALLQLAAILDAQGSQYEQALVLDTLHRLDGKIPLMRLLAACQACGDRQTALAAIERWKAHPGNDHRMSAPAVITYLFQQNHEEGIRIAAQIAEEAPDDPRVMEQVGLARLARKEWKEAETIFRRLTAAQPMNPNFQIGLANALVGQRKASEALEMLKSGIRRDAVMVDLKLIEIYLSLELLPQARLLASNFLRGDNPESLIRITELFQKAGYRNDALALLASGIDIAYESRRLVAAFTLMKELIRNAPPDTPDAVRYRWLQRLRLFSRGNVALESEYYEFTDKHQPASDRLRELEADWNGGKGSPIAGAWLAAAFIQLNQMQAVAQIIPQLAAHPGTSDALLVWLDDRCRFVHRYELSLLLTSQLAARHPDSDALSRHLHVLNELKRKEEALTLLQEWTPRALFHPRLFAPLALAARELHAYGPERELLLQAYANDPYLRDPKVACAYAGLLIKEADFSRAKRVLRQLFRNPARITPDTKAVLADYFRASGRNLNDEARDFDLTPEQTAEIATLLAASPAP